MLELEPGPIGPLTSDALAPFPRRPSFETLVVDALGAFWNVDNALALAALHTAASPPDDLEALYAATVGAAEADVNHQLAQAPGSPAPTLVGQGDSTDRIRQSVLQYLPQPDAPITATFDEPPRPPTEAGPPQEPEGPVV